MIGLDLSRRETQRTLMCVMIIANQAEGAKLTELAGFYRASCRDLLGSQ